MNRLQSKTVCRAQPRTDTNNYIYVGGLSVRGLAISGYLLYSKFKKSEQTLIDVPVLLCQRLALNHKEIF